MEDRAAYRKAVARASTLLRTRASAVNWKGQEPLPFIDDVGIVGEADLAQNPKPNRKRQRARGRDRVSRVETSLQERSKKSKHIGAVVDGSNNGSGSGSPNRRRRSRSLSLPSDKRRRRSAISLESTVQGSGSSSTNHNQQHQAVVPGNGISNLVDSASHLCTGVFRVEMPASKIVWHGSTWAVANAQAEVWDLLSAGLHPHPGMQKAFDSGDRNFTVTVVERLGMFTEHPPDYVPSGSERRRKDREEAEQGGTNGNKRKSSSSYSGHATTKPAEAIERMLARRVAHAQVSLFIPFNNDYKQFGPPSSFLFLFASVALAFGNADTKSSCRANI